MGQSKHSKSHSNVSAVEHCDEPSGDFVDQGPAGSNTTSQKQASFFNSHCTPAPLMLAALARIYQPFCSTSRVAQLKIPLHCMVCFEYAINAKGTLNTAALANGKVSKKPNKHPKNPQETENNRRGRY